MKVYLVRYYDYDASFVEGVYSSHEVAEAALRKVRGVASNYDKPNFTIEEYDVIDMVDE